jgi:hypothetical protein
MEHARGEQRAQPLAEAQTEGLHASSMKLINRYQDNVHATQEAQHTQHPAAAAGAGMTTSQQQLRLQQCP